DQQAHHDRDGGGDSKLIEKPPRYARHERNGDEDNYQAEGGRHNRQPDLGRGRSSSLPGMHLLFFDKSEDVLEHNYRIVYYDADHQNQRQHRYAVQGEVERPHHSECSDRRRRDRYRRDYRRTPASHKRQHYKRSHDAAEYQMKVYLVKRGIDV